MNQPKQVHKHPTCSLCDGVVHVGSMKFDVLYEVCITGVL